ncbi:MAG TPA: SDR family oxidoreductase [Pseudonocardiaceae bacterium]|jgi:NAD(P)-dependent dehydrogenase (short-subunit alcohol dehydrogenase family)
MRKGVTTQQGDSALRAEHSGVRAGQQKSGTMPRVAVVTGGASGIGYALAAALMARGDIVTVADIDEQGATRCAEDLASRYPGQADGAALDVEDAAAVAHMIQSVKKQHGRLDLVFNNAGIGVGGAADEHTLEHWNRAIDVNLRGVVHGVHAAYPIMLEQGFGHIVNTASMAGLYPVPHKIAYVTTKYAIVGLSLALRHEAAKRGVKVSVICPGYVETPLLDNINPGLPQTTQGARTRERAAREQGRLCLPEEVAHDVMRGIVRNESVIVTTSTRLAERFAKLSPAIAQWGASYSTADEV